MKIPERNNGPQYMRFRPFVLMAQLALLAIAVGLISSMAAIAFVDSVAWLNRTLLISPISRVQYERHPQLLLAATILVPTIGGIVVGWMLERFADNGRSLGPVDVIRSVVVAAPFPNFRSGLTSTFGAVLSLGCGASVGQYGPMVFLGAMAGKLASFLRLQIDTFPAIAMGCGVAAAISTAFNAPIAGVVFAHEVIHRHYSLRAFAPTVVASASGYVVANVLFDRPALFRVAFDGVEHGYEFLLFAVLGGAAALVAITFMRLLLACGDRAARLKLPRPFKTGFAGLAVGVTALWLPDVLGIGAEALRFATIEGAFAPLELVVLVAAKIGLTALCIGFGFAGGVFSPALLMGILFGALAWTGVDAILIDGNSGIVPYAICGMMAFTSSVVGAPLAMILVVFELTRNYDLTIAAMVGVVFANLVSNQLFGRSLFDVQLARAGIDLRHGTAHAKLSLITVASHAIADFPCGHDHETVRQVLSRTETGDWNEIFVVDQDNRFCGIVRTSNVLDAGDTALSALTRQPSKVMDEGTTLFDAMEAMAEFDGDAVPIVNSENGQLIGVVTERDIVNAYLRSIGDLRRRQHAIV